MERIRNPIEWVADQISGTADHLGRVAEEVRGAASVEPEIRQISTDDLREALSKGVEDLKTFRSDVIFLAIMYPIVGIVLAGAMFDTGLIPLLFPAASGFALVGPFAAVGLYELSRRREKGLEANWAHAFDVIASPSFGAILTLGLGLVGVFVFWLVLAQMLANVTIGPQPPVSTAAFLDAVFNTPGGQTLIVGGIALGALFAVFVLAISFVSFPMLLDRKVGLRTAVATSLKLVSRNPRTALTWGAIVAVSLLLGSIPLFLGMIFVLPLLGHATWHLYRRAVTFGPAR